MTQREGHVFWVCWASRRPRAFLAIPSAGLGISGAQVTHFLVKFPDLTKRDLDTLIGLLSENHLETTSKFGFHSQG